LFDFLINAVLRRKHGKHVSAKEEASRQRMKAACQRYNAQLAVLRESITDKNARHKSAEFYSVIRDAFRESLSLKYEATIQEIAEEIEQEKHYSPRLREEVTHFLNEVVIMEYGYEEFRQLADEKKHEKERLLREYISEMENEGEHVKKDTKRKIAGIVAESVPHTDREFLVEMTDRFKPILHQLF